MMSENNTVITTIYKQKVQDLLEPINAKDSYVEKSETIEQVFLLLGKKNHVWVVNDTQSLEVIGVITESDTIQLFAPPYSALQSFDKPTLQSLQYGLVTMAEEIMSKQPVMVHSDDLIADIIIKMKQHKIKQLPVVDEAGRLIGEITLAGLIKQYSKQQIEMNQKKNNIIS
jgi:CBS domain-containing protein